MQQLLFLLQVLVPRLAVAGEVSDMWRLAYLVFWLHESVSAAVLGHAQSSILHAGLTARPRTIFRMSSEASLLSATFIFPCDDQVS